MVNTLEHIIMFKKPFAISANGLSNFRDAHLEWDAVSGNGSAWRVLAV